MPQLAQWWRQIMPSSHYIESHVSVVSYGAAWPNVASQLSGYWGFICLLPLIYLLSRKLLPITITANTIVTAYDSDAALPAKGNRMNMWRLMLTELKAIISDKAIAVTLFGGVLFYSILYPLPI